MGFLSNVVSFQLKERVYGLPPALHYRAQLLSALVASANDVSQGYGLTSEVSRIGDAVTMLVISTACVRRCELYQTA